MLTLEEQIERLADAAVEQLDQQPPTAVTVRSRAWIGLAAAVLLTVMVVGVTWILVSRSGSSVPADERVPSDTLALNTPTTAYDPSQTWLVPNFVPDGYDYSYALYIDSQDPAGDLTTAPNTFLAYASSTSTDVLTIMTGTRVPDAQLATDTVSIDGDRWSVHELVAPDETLVISVFRADDGEFGTAVSASGLDLDTVIEVAASLEQQPVTALPRPPFTGPDASGFVVASGTYDGEPVELRAETDGRMIQLDASFPFRLAGFMTVGGVTTPGADAFENGGPEHDISIDGLLHPDVARVDVVLTDGRIVTTAAQDEHGFAENFFYVSFPTTADAVDDLQATLIARDADGNELTRLDDVITHIAP